MTDEHVERAPVPRLYELAPGRERPGDFARHRDKELALDDREVTRIEKDWIYMRVGDQEIGPALRSNYTYYRPAGDED